MDIFERNEKQKRKGEKKVSAAFFFALALKEIRPVSHPEFIRDVKYRKSIESNAVIKNGVKIQ